MNYNLVELLRMMPFVCWGFLGIVALTAEIHNIATWVRIRPEPINGSFIPPSQEGYPYYVGSGTVVYIINKGNGLFRCYLVEGDIPQVFIRKDRYGKYFTLRCSDTSTVERLVDQAFNKEKSF